MTRAENVAEAQRLRVQGLLLREIAEQMGSKIKTVHTWLADPDLARQAARRETYRGTCAECGAPTDGSNGRDDAPRQCRACFDASAAERMQAVWGEHRAAVEAAWAEGLTCREMCERFGWKNKVQVAVMRHRGYNLPHRRSPEQVARIAAGWEKTKGRKVTA